MRLMTKIKTSALNQLAKIKEKLRGAVPLSPADIFLLEWFRRMKHREARRAHYRSRNAAYPYHSRRQCERNLRKMKKADARGRVLWNQLDRLQLSA